MFGSHQTSAPFLFEPHELCRLRADRMSDRAGPGSRKDCRWPAGHRGFGGPKGPRKQPHRLQPVHIQIEDRDHHQHQSSQRVAPVLTLAIRVKSPTPECQHLPPLRIFRGAAASVGPSASAQRTSTKASATNNIGHIESCRGAQGNSRNQLTVSVNFSRGAMATSKDDDDAEGDHQVTDKGSSTESSESSSTSVPTTSALPRASLSLRWDSTDTEDPRCRDFGIRDYLTATNESIDAEEESSVAGDFNTGLGVPPPRFSIDSLDATTALLLDTHVTDLISFDTDILSSSRSSRSLRKSLSLPHAAATFAPNLPKIREIHKASVSTAAEDQSSQEQQVELKYMETSRSQKRRVTVDLNTTTSGRRCDTWDG